MSDISSDINNTLNMFAEGFLGISQEDHYSRNQYQDGNAPDSLDDLMKSYNSEEEFAQNWEQEKFPHCHNLYGEDNNVSYRGIGDETQKQYVFYADGTLNTSAANGGTFDFNSPMDAWSKSLHLRTDVLTWIIWGNTPEDFEEHGYDGIAERGKALGLTIADTALDGTLDITTRDISSALDCIVQTARDAEQQISDSIAEKASELSAVAAEKAREFGEAAQNLADSVVEDVQDLVDAAAVKAQEFADAAEELAEEVTGKAEELGADAVAKAQELADAAKAKAQELADATAEHAKELADAIADTASDFADNASELAQEAADIAEDLAVQLADSLNDALEDLFHDLGMPIDDPLGIDPTNPDASPDGNQDTSSEDFSSPLVLDLNNNGRTSTSLLMSDTYFDLDGDGFSERTAWIEADDGLLVIDKNQNGLVDSGSELFGNYSQKKDGATAENGFAALTDYDSNNDDVIDSNDDVFSSLQVWVDENQDGVSAGEELFSLTDLHIQSINIDATEVNTEEKWNQISHESSFVQDVMDEEGNVVLDENGNVLTDEKAIRDVWFASDRQDTIYQFEGELSSDVAALPEMKGSGRVRNLSHSMEGFLLAA